MRNSVRRLSETKIMSLLAESNISSNKVVSCLLKIGQKIWKRSHRKRHGTATKYKKTVGRLFLIAVLIESVYFFRLGILSVDQNGSLSLIGGVRLGLAVLLLCIWCLIVIVAPEDALEQRLLLWLMTLFIRWLIPVILVVCILILWLAYSSNRFYVGLYSILFLALPLGLLHITQTDIWLSFPLMRYSRYLKPEKMKTLLWVAIIILCFVLIQNNRNLSVGNHKYLTIVVAVAGCTVGEFVAYAHARWNGGIDLIHDIIKDANAIIMNISDKVNVDSKELIEDLISLDGHLSEDILHRRYPRHVIASEELRIFLMLYVGRIVSNNISFCENRSRKVIISGSTLLSINADELLRTMNNYVYEDAEKKGRKILEKTQEQCKEDLCDFLFALREHLIEERCNV